MNTGVLVRLDLAIVIGIVAVVGTALALTQSGYTIAKKSNAQNNSHHDDDDDDDEFLDLIDETLKDDFDGNDETFRMVLCVNNSLGMGKGKIGAQCGHAAVGAFQIADQNCPNAVDAWENFGSAKIVVKVDNEEKMMQVAEKAKQRGLVTYIVQDEGRTQIPEGSQTVLAIGPAPASAFDDITSKLKLL